MWASLVVLGLWGNAEASGSEFRRIKKQTVVLQKSCDIGDLNHCMDFADRTRNGHGVDVDKGGAAALYRQGCEAGRARGCVGLAELVLAGEVEGDKAVATESLRVICGGWNGSHDDLLDLPYLEGQGVAMACVNLGHVQRQKGDTTVAKQLYRKACAWDNLGCFSAAAIMNAKQEAVAKTLTARACGVETVDVAPTTVVSRSEMERGCLSIRTHGTLPDDLGAAQANGGAAAQ